MKSRTLMLGALALTIVAVAVGGFFALAARQATIDIEGRIIKVEVMRTPRQLQQGLSGRDHLPRDSGMLFILPERGLHAFWMKDMKFALDIIWLDAGRVVEVATLPAPTSTAYIPRHEPLSQADSVLELNAGMAHELGLKQGFHLILPE